MDQGLAIHCKPDPLIMIAMATRPSPESPPVRNRQVEWLAVLMFLFMLALALAPGIKAVAGLTWGASVDFHRDGAFVRALLEGHYGEDPTYLGAAMWYSPMMTWVEAAAASITGLPVSEAIIRMGAWLNLLAPIAFFIMAWHFLGPARAVACTAVFLFFAIGQEPGWAVPTYSPRMISVTFCQWFFYLELVLIDRALRTTRIGPSIAAGAGAGITFLAHAGPAMISVLIIAFFTLAAIVAALRRRDKRAAWARIKASTAAAIAFTVGTLPLTWYIVGYYGMHVVNTSGFLYTYYAVTLRQGAIFLHHNLSLVNLVAVAGLVGVLFLARRLAIPHRARALLLAWLGISLLLFAYSYASTVLTANYGMHVPLLLPTYHFYFYAKGSLAVFAGLAAWELLAWAWSRFRRRTPRAMVSAQSVPVAVLFAVIALACTLNYPAYATRRDVFIVRNRNLAFAENTGEIEAAERIHALLPWSTVVLCDVDLSIWPMLPTARHVVATASTMGNPYLDQSQRQTDNALLLLGMQAPRPGTKALLDEYGVTNLLVRTEDQAAMPEAAHWFPKVEFHNAEYVLRAR